MSSPRGLRRKLLVSAVVAAASAWLAGVAAAPAIAEGSGHAHAFYVATDGSSANSGRSCHSAKFSTISAAVAAAAAGGTVTVCHGTYQEDVLIDKSLNLIGQHATIDATGLENAVHVVASDVSVRGFTLENANGEGLLVGVDPGPDTPLSQFVVLSHVSVAHVAAIDDNKGFNGTENGNCRYAGDCGGGIHFNAVSWSSVRDSKVVGNSDGILLTDDYGPTSHNVIEDNFVSDNLTECGIVLPGHNPGAVSFDSETFAVTGRNPTVGGVFDNIVRGNVTLRNGTAKAPPEFGGGGSGSGIGIFGSGPGTGAYDNVIEDNFMADNGLAGFTIHAHLPGGEDVNGNRIVDNAFGTNNTGGDGYDGPPGPVDFQTTAIAVYSAPLVHMTITHNRISNNAIGIWLSNTVTARGLHHNLFRHVTTKVVRG